MNSFKRSLFSKTQTCLKQGSICKISQIKEKGKQISKLIPQYYICLISKHVLVWGTANGKFFFLTEQLINNLNADLIDT